ncbi:hypothetical protein MVES_001251 [Malassezia vespertilionis]|uniref:4'-phosphopantetheinyl transferase domain-containing protein n=1 Tax=Malassezia vespertilionis TaxID=2020962 RepID=A0A2N1JDT6_9BASI|nr:hypothetical protein MVES_001251 [Malassezia vespertilionis]
MACTLEVVDIACWNQAPYLHVEKEHSQDPASLHMQDDVAQLVTPYDAEGAAKVQRFLRPVDRARAFVARLLPRVWYASQGTTWGMIKICTTKAGRPFAAAPPSIVDTDFNMSHDGDFVVLATYKGSDACIGVDVMEMKLPVFEPSVASFVETMRMCMTDREYAWVQEAADNDALQRLMRLWTYKEAYTKSLGLGLGCDFKRVEIPFWAQDWVVLRDDEPQRNVVFAEYILSREHGMPSLAVIALTSAHENALSSDLVRNLPLTVHNYTQLLRIARSLTRVYFAQNTRTYADARKVWKQPRPVRPNDQFRQFLEDKGFIAAVVEPPQNVAGQTSRRTRLPPSKAMAMAKASKALRMQAKQDASTSDAVEAKQPSSLPLSAARPLDNGLPEVVAVTTAQSYNFDVLLSSGRLPATWRWLEDREVIYIPSWPSATEGEEGQGSAFIFRSGCYVTWGMSSEDKAALYKNVLCGASAPVEQDRYAVAGDEAMDYVYLPEERTRIVGDLIVVGKPPQDTGRKQSATPFLLQAQLAFSQGVAASARLSVQELALSEYLASVSPIPGELQLRGRVPLGRREVIRKMGTLLSLRQRINLDTDNFVDDPELYWENGMMESLYRSTCHALDMKPRFDALNEKLNHCEHLLGVLRALLTEESSHRMELIIIYLIAFEVGMALVSHEYVPTPLALWRAVLGDANT